VRQSQMFAFSFFSIYHDVMSTLADQTVLPPTGEVSDLRELSAVLASDTELSLVDGSGRTFQLSVELRNVLAHAAGALSDGRAVTVEPLRTLLSTQEAANLLGISRPTLVKLLESGEIAFIKPGRHRRVELQHLLDYQRQLRTHRSEELATMATEAADDDAYRAINGFTGTR
jgi:excisionase family DNA binding protein